MRKWLMILCIALLLGGCSFSADEAAENVREQLRDFPTSAEFVKMDDGERLQFYDRLQRLYGAFRDKYVMAGVCFLVCMMCHSLVEIVLFSYNYDMIFWFVLGGTVSRAAFVKAQAKTVNAAVTVRNND